MGKVLVIKGTNFESVAVAKDNLPDGDKWQQLTVTLYAEKPISYNSGNINESATNKFWHSDYINVKGYISLKYTNPYINASSTTGLAFYNDNKQYISGVKGIENSSAITDYKEETVAIPANASYVRFSMFNKSYGLEFEASVS